MKGNVGNLFFKFEDYIESGVRCIPMIVRFKLDACGIKLKLSEWTRMTARDRASLAVEPCDTEEETAQYRDRLRALVARCSGNEATAIPVPQNPVWSRVDEIPYTIEEKLREINASITLDQWRILNDLQRFALLKLSYPGHENKNFPIALQEFGLTEADRVCVER